MRLKASNVIKKLLDRLNRGRHRLVVHGATTHAPRKLWYMAGEPSEAQYGGDFAIIAFESVDELRRPLSFRTAWRALMLRARPGDTVHVDLALLRLWRPTNEKTIVRALRRGVVLEIDCGDGQRIGLPFTNCNLKDLERATGMSLVACISEATRNAMRRAREQGGRISRHAPLGTRYVDGRVVEDRVEMDAIRGITKLHTSGWSQPAIARLLNDAGVPTRDGAPWNPSRVRRALFAAERIGINFADYAPPASRAAFGGAPVAPDLSLMKTP